MEAGNQKQKKFWGGVLVFLGFWLSPLSPWNDLFTNLPIAYAFGFLFSLISESFFAPMIIVGYWLSNVMGFVLMHYGYVVVEGDSYSFRKNWKNYLFWTTLYTVIVFLLVYFDVLPNAEDFKDSLF